MKTKARNQLILNVVPVLQGCVNNSQNEESLMRLYIIWWVPNGIPLVIVVVVYENESRKNLYDYCALLKWS